ncbi:MAG: succinate dehydrogenase assembly factor 2 [Betaproteobacteria bacterium]
MNPSKLRWRARRGMLENDLILTRFLDRCATRLTPAQTAALLQLLDLPDTELFDLLMVRSEPAPPLDHPDVRALLEQLRAA